jgi:hypothetical protein
LIGQRRFWIAIGVAIAIAGAIAVVTATGHASGPAPPERITGLQQGPGGPPGTNQIFASTGCWIGEVDGQWYQIYAGTKTEPGTGQGLRSELLVFLAPAHVGGTERAREIGAYAPPEGGTKALEIKSASGAVLTIKTATGSTLKFNVATQAFE